jgi:hypothetical protein
VVKKRGVILYVTFATKNLKARCDVARQPLWRYVKDRHRSCNETWRFATDGKNLEYFFKLVAELHVSTQLSVAQREVLELPEGEGDGEHHNAPSSFW